MIRTSCARGNLKGFRAFSQGVHTRKYYIDVNRLVGIAFESIYSGLGLKNCLYCLEFAVSFVDWCFFALVIFMAFLA